MKSSTILTTVAALLITSSSAWAQSATGCQKPYYRPVAAQNCPPEYRPPFYQQPIEPDPVADPFDPVSDPVDPAPADPNPQEPFQGDPQQPVGVVKYEVKVQHPTTFEWVTVKVFDDELEAAEYADLIEQRYWVIYSTGSETKLAEARSLSDARSKSSALRRAGLSIRGIKPLEAEIAEESLQDLFDDAASQVAAGEESKVPNELQPLLGFWEAVTRDAEGNVTRILMNLKPDATAELTVPTANGGQVKIERDFAVDNGVFKLTDGDKELILGNVVEAGAEKVVLGREDGNITFLRP